jgi:hypothetical protein
VSNYPLPPRPEAELALLQRVETVRRIEKAERFAQQLLKEQQQVNVLA